MASTGFKFPTLGQDGGCGGSVSNPQNITAEDGVDADFSGSGSYCIHGKNFNFVIPETAEILGIAFRSIHIFDAGSATITASISFDGGLTFTAPKTVYAGNNAGRTDVTVGSGTDLWGREWKPSEFSNTNFVARLSYGGTNTGWHVDMILVSILYSAAQKVHAKRLGSALNT